MFEIWKKVVCIKRFFDPDGINTIEVGREFVLRGIKKAPCGCHEMDLDVGLSINPNWNLLCEFCFRRYPRAIDGVLWFSSEYFAPIDNELSEISLEDLLEELECLEYAEC